MREIAERRLDPVITRRRLNDEAGRWLIVTALALTDLILLPVFGIAVDWPSGAERAQTLALLLLGAVAGHRLQSRTAGKYRQILLAAEDFCRAALLLACLTLVVAPFTYAGAGFDLPLIDDRLAAADRALGFDWTAFRDWVSAQPRLHDALSVAYFTPFNQCVVLMALAALWQPGRRASELIWAYLIALLICSAFSILVPALSMGGEVASYQALLIAFRHGTPPVLAWDRLEGIVSFPSFHAALAVIFVWAARHRVWALLLAVPLNTLMLLATPPIGGHYLVDSLGGILVALIAIALTLRLQPASSSSDSRLALPPDAVVSVETTRSTAKRGR
jgi:membrane-associated phospholipid phosphatase